MTNNPFEFSERLLAYLRGELDAEQSALLERELERSPALSELADELRHASRIDEQLRIMASFPVPGQRATAHRKRQNGRIKRIRYAVAAACLLMVAGVGTLLMIRQTDLPGIADNHISPGEGKVTLHTTVGEEVDISQLDGEYQLTAVELTTDGHVLKMTVNETAQTGSTEGVEPHYNTIRIAYAGTQIVELPDGTRVHLNSGTTFEFPTPFVGAERRVKLSGEAYFEVATDASMPFVVETESMDIVALGTSFNVKAYADDRLISATLTEGKVLVNSPAATRSIPLQIGQQATYDKQTGNVDVRQVDTEVFTAWTDGVFYFKDFTLDEILRTVSRWYDLKITYHDTPTKNKYNGRMPMYSAVEDVLRKFELSGGVSFRLEDGTIHVYSK